MSYLIFMAIAGILLLAAIIAAIIIAIRKR